ncbi:matrilin-2-like isoform X2 [Actinia tenebrosa]|uniref:Matrilin-2-like isoform X2 n=1 Tax=Actinia tenebrosa TaxID=6105 RepID=A0A6P8I7B5_ACTTE|nr:matrilin-2-like isoform X2 [Actinia tenebrosa]
MALSHVVFVCILVVAFWDFKTVAYPDFIEENGLNINGSNICQDPTSKTKNVTFREKVKKKVSYAVPCYHLIPMIIVISKVLVKNCTKYKTEIEEIEKVFPQKLHGYSLRCCYGWKKINQNDTECLKPICVHGCKHGKCVAADTCACDRGWIGFTCSQDVNECDKNNGGCQQECLNTPGSHTCGCTRGYITDATDKTKCKDINECQAPQPRCLCANSVPQCNATCVNTIGNFKCVCPKGYQLNGPNTCTDVDECLSSITNDCPHKCINKPGSYECPCFKGFKYDKKTSTCKDLNECADNNGGCEHRCLNFYGSYRCRCNRGYRMAPDRRKCLPYI